MKVAIPVNEKKGLDAAISPDYSGCKYFILSDIEDQTIVANTIISRELPDNINSIRGVEAFMLVGKGVEAVIVQKIDEKERISLVGNAIRVFQGAKGTAFDALRQFIDGRLEENSRLKSTDVCHCEGDCG